MQLVCTLPACLWIPSIQPETEALSLHSSRWAKKQANECPLLKRSLSCLGASPWAPASARSGSRPAGTHRRRAQEQAVRTSRTAGPAALREKPAKAAADSENSEKEHQRSMPPPRRQPAAMCCLSFEKPLT